MNSEFFKNIYHHSIIPHNNSGCDTKIDNSIIDEIIIGKNLCPWREEIVHRDNFYPRAIAKKICHCKNCPYLNPDVTKQDVQFKCTPVYTIMPALKRGNCIQGVYEWKKGFDQIPLACVCSQSTKIVFASNKNSF